jgi:hypothetical protein
LIGKYHFHMVRFSREKNSSDHKRLPRHLNRRGYGRDLIAVSDIQEKRLVTAVDGTASGS